MRANITVVTCNRLKLTRICLESLFTKTEGEFFVNIIDNGSHDGSVEYLRHFVEGRGNARLVELERNMGVAIAANMGWALTDADHYIKLDNDIEILDGRWLANLARLAERYHRVGQAGYLYGDWQYKHELIMLDGEEPFISSSGLCNGGCVLIPRRIHEEFGFWNEDYGKYGFEDLDYSVRLLRHGYVVGYAPDNLIRHLGRERHYLNPENEATKSFAVQKTDAERIYVLNQFLYDHGILGKYVERRHLEEIRDGRFRFFLNKNYLPIIKLQHEYMKKISYDCGSDSVAVDLTGLKF